MVARNSCLAVYLAISFFWVQSRARTNKASQSVRSFGFDTATAALIIVDQSGNGDHHRIQDAIDAVSSGNTEHVFILIRPGVYEEKVIVPENKPFKTLSGTKASTTIIKWNESGSLFNSPTFSVFASDFMGRFLTIQNTHGRGARAVALRVSGDRVAFIGCRVLSYQDTFLDDRGRHYFRDCYIEGANDFICKNAASLFKVIFMFLASL